MNNQTVRFWIGEGARAAGFPEEEVTSGLEKADEKVPGAVLDVRRIVPDKLGHMIRDANAAHLRAPTLETAGKLIGVYSAVVTHIIHTKDLQ